MTPLQRRALTLQLASPLVRPDVLRGQHRDDGHGRCTGCTLGGTGIPHEPWPCFIRRLADEAHLIHTGFAAQQAAA